MRLFAAVDPSPEAISSLSAVLPIDDRLRYVPPEQWHVTVAFYGEVPDPVLAELTERLSRVARRSPVLRLCLAGGGTFPPRARLSRVLWCGVAGDLPQLSRLAERAVAAGRRCGLDLEHRPFRAHLTLARCRREPVELGTAVATLSEHVGPEWIAGELHLVRSHLGPQTRHERLASWPLGRQLG
jgi:2'-5' RNA ligase